MQFSINMKVSKGGFLVKAVRYSKQRELILNEMKCRSDHPTAEQVYTTLKADHPELSLGTIYRNLNFLSDTGEITKLNVGDGSVHFDGNTIPHVHFVCRCCHQIYDLELNQDCYQQLINDYPHQVEKMDIILNGRCEACLDNPSQS